MDADPDPVTMVLIVEGNLGKGPQPTLGAITVFFFFFFYMLKPFD